jgi:hypothetical protein
MASSRYRVTPAQIGNSSGLRLPAAFYRDHPEFSGAPGQKAMAAEDDELLADVTVETMEPAGAPAQE